METYKINVVSSQGHEEHEVPENQALMFITDQVKKHGKWLYLDGRQYSSDVELEDIKSANRIDMMSALVGGRIL